MFLGAFMKLKLTLIAVACTSLLAACGGGGSDSTSNNNNSNTTLSTVEEKVASNVSALGATVIDSGVQDFEAYDLVASVGDSWRLLINRTTKKARVKVLKSDYGLSGDSADEDIDITIAGNTMAVASKTGSNINVVVDTRTKNVTGKLTVTTGSTTKTSTVSGTGYSVSTLSSVAGDYAFVGRTYCYQGSTTSSPACTDTPSGKDFAVGTLRVNSTGDTALICPESIITSDTVCTNPDDQSTSTPEAVSITTENGIKVMKKGSQSFGSLQVVPGDLGTVLLIDKSGPNSASGLSTGVFAARKLNALAGNEFDGSWSCINDASNTYNFTVSGNSIAAAGGSASGSASLAYNRVAVGDTAAGMPTLNGLIASYDAEEGPFDIIIPLTSSFVYAVKTETGTTTDLKVCKRL
jgi:hypothetical protein